MKFNEIARQLSLGAKVARPNWKETTHITFDPTTSTFMTHLPDKEPFPFRNMLGEFAMADHILADDWYIMEEAPFNSPKELFEHYHKLNAAKEN